MTILKWFFLLNQSNIHEIVLNLDSLNDSCSYCMNSLTELWVILWFDLIHNNLIFKLTLIIVNKDTVLIKNSFVVKCYIIGLLVIV